MGGSTPSTTATATPAPAAVATVEEVKAPELGEDEAEKQKKAQEGKRDLRVPVGAAASDTVGTGVSSGLNV